MEFIVVPCVGLNEPSRVGVNDDAVLAHENRIIPAARICRRTMNLSRLRMTFLS
jgi:hypothetical protein